MDVGVETVSRIRSMLQIDEEWSRPTDRGFSWWAYRTRQDITAELPWDDDGSVLANVCVRTWMLAPPEASADLRHLLLAEMNHETTGGSFRQSDGGEIVHELSVTVGPDGVEWVARACATFAMVALTEGVAVANRYAERLRARPLESYPGMQPRPFPDDMLRIAEPLALAGSGKSSWEGSVQFSGAIELIHQGRGFSADLAGLDGITCEFGFGARRTSMFVLQPTRTGRVPDRSGRPAAVPHDVFGHGLRAWLVLPLATNRPDASALADHLNTMEYERRTDSDMAPMHFGAWTVWDPRGRATPSYQMFIPNFLSPVIGAENIALHFWQRALMASRTLLPSEEPQRGASIAEAVVRRSEEVFEVPPRVPLTPPPIQQAPASSTPSASQDEDDSEMPWTIRLLLSREELAAQARLKASGVSATVAPDGRADTTALPQIAGWSVRELAQLRYETLLRIRRHIVEQDDVFVSTATSRALRPDDGEWIRDWISHRQPLIDAASTATLVQAALYCWAALSPSDSQSVVEQALAHDALGKDPADAIEFMIRVLKRSAEVIAAEPHGESGEEIPGSLARRTPAEVFSAMDQAAAAAAHSDYWQPSTIQPLLDAAAVHHWGRLLSAGSLAAPDPKLRSALADILES